METVSNIITIPGAEKKKIIAFSHIIKSYIEPITIFYS